jgi:protein-S-isoprenylcysteine O-methyltransferase Ste14
MKDLLSPRFCFGLLIFALGMFINIKHDYLLVEQRKGKEGYVIPRGYLFDYISMPHYFGEIVEWIGFGIATNTLAGYLFSLSTFANLCPRALETHKWYFSKFGDEYPKDRKAVIPFII